MSTGRWWRRAVTTAIAQTLAAPWSLVVLGAFYLLIVAVLAGLWATAADAAGGEIVGYSSVALFWYIAIAEAGINSLPIRLIEELGDDIGSERLAIEMIRPASALWVRFTMHLGASVVRLAVCAAVGTSLALLVAGAPPSLLGLVFAIPSLLLAIVINSLAQFAFAGASFWVRDAKAAWFLYQKMVFVLGGMLLPLEVLPGSLETAAKLLPFMAMAYAPARLAAGFVEPWLLGVQLFWVVVGVIATHRLYAAGERQLVEAP